MNFYLEYGGGLGDIFYQMYQDGSYNVLNDLGPDDRATVVLITHNPFARELFDYHPKADQIEVKDLGYWPPEEDTVMRERHGLARTRQSLPVKPNSIEFHPAPHDFPILDLVLGKNYVVFSVSAGLPERDIPKDLVTNLLREVKDRSLLPVFVGRNYDRHGRIEYRPEQNGVLDLIDKLTVPGVARVVQGATGVVCCHSAINILSWLLRKSQLLLYPQSAYEQHILTRDQWAFGVDFPECRHAPLGSAEVEKMAEEFFNEIKGQTHRHTKMNSAVSQMTPKNIKTVPLPPESQVIQLDESIARLTPAHEVKFLCWLAQQTPGNVVEIGCNKGLTTRDLAKTNSDKIIYAVDYFADDSQMAPEQRREKPPLQDFCVYAREMQNVLCLHENPAKLNYEALQNVKLVFIDGDHGFDSVKGDTQPALKHFQAHKGGVLVWHDYYDEAPDWVGVKRYVDSLDLKIKHIEGTWLALAKVKGKR